MNDQHTPFLVVGGGIGGLATALAVAKAGRRVHVLEQDTEFGEIGAGLQLAPNALRVLDRLGVLQRVYRASLLLREQVFMNAMTGDRAYAIDFGARFQAAFGYPYLVVHRRDLIAALAQACAENPRISWEHARAVVAVEDLGERVRVRCAGGGTYLAEAVVGADGRRSVVRRAIVSDDLVQTGFVAYRGVVPFTEAAGASRPDQVVMWTGPDRHFVQYPLRGGELYNQVAVFRSDAYHADHDEWGLPAELDALFGETCAQLRIAVRQVNRTRRWAMADRDPVENWTSGRITLLGDSAHPMLQYLAQGAAQALEDAECLSRAFTTAGDDIESAFLAYQRERVPRTASVQLRTRELGELMHRSPTEAVEQVPRTPRSDPEDLEIVDWLYQERVRAFTT
ncbi:MAG TPA: FAD-dependent monooxygenase [Pseudonocardiaceae bacterium]|jgi:salicylate hydroxylase|nr:FAD-dependent monooxygenase [Pseudonocardiaceae bacterium]